jgi:hypothetical protein
MHPGHAIWKARQQPSSRPENKKGVRECRERPDLIYWMRAWAPRQ